MFTGLIEHIGTVSDIQELDTTASGGSGWSVTISDSAAILSDCHLGDSISVNGACLTVTEFDANSFKVGLAPETLTRTNLRQLKIGSKVNLERAMQLGARYGGHNVQGHVDATATIVQKEPDGNSIRYLFQLPFSAAEYTLSLVTKGFIAIDGTSLTLTATNPTDRTFGIMLIAHSQEKVILSQKNVGDEVNIEIDVVSKQVTAIVQQSVEARLQALVDAAVQKALASR